MDKNNQIKKYRPLKRRFYILFTFCVYSFSCGIIWNSWQPLIKSINELYRWTNTQVNLLNNINALVVCILIFPFIILWNKCGIKFCYSTSSCIILLGCLVRVFPGDYITQSILLQIGNAISAYGNLMSYVGSTAISAIWFPTHERSRSTCTSLAFSTMGSVVAPIAASQIVPVFDKNLTEHDPHYKDLIENAMLKFMFLHCSVALFGLILIILYFPSKPKYLPCKSSEKSLRIDLKAGCKILSKSKQFWIVFIFNFVISGVNSGVISVLPSIIEPLGVSQKENGILIAVGNLCVFISSIIGGWLGDKCSYKTISILSIPPTVGTYVLFGFQSLKLIRHDLGSIYAIVLVMLFISNITSNISFEMGCEASFPASEEVATAMLGFATNLGIVIFLSITMITDKNVTWIPFFYAGATLLMLPLMILYKDERKRSHCDLEREREESFSQIIIESENNIQDDEEEGEEIQILKDCSLIRFPN